jgi:hypothetical protein
MTARINIVAGKFKKPKRLKAEFDTRIKALEAKIGR